MPAYTTIRDIIQGTASEELEKSFRKHSNSLVNGEQNRLFVGCNGKVRRGSFDDFNDQKAMQILSVFANNEQIILAHELIEDKSHEIPTAQGLMATLGLSGCLFTFDALHCQKNAGDGENHWE